MSFIFILPVILSFLIAAVSLPPWIRKTKRVDLVWRDMNKFDKVKRVAGSGGIIVVLSFIFGVLSYIAIETFALGTGTNIVQLFALLTAISIASFIGFVDDIFGWIKGGLSVKARIFLTIIVAIPLSVINAGSSQINIPLLGVINIGIWYPLLLIPLGVVGTTTTYNFLAGFNGLEAGQGIIIISFLSFIAYLTSSPWLALAGLCVVAGLIVFYWYNKFPSKVFPGDTMTYAIGAMIASMAILGNFEKIAVFIFIPYILEVILKLRGRLKYQSFGAPQRDGYIEEPYDKIYGLEHLAIRIIKKLKGKVHEKEVTYLIFSFQLLICLAGLFIFKEWLF